MSISSCEMRDTNVNQVGVCVSCRIFPPSDGTRDGLAVIHSALVRKSLPLCIVTKDRTTAPNAVEQGPCLFELELKIINSSGDEAGKIMHAIKESSWMPGHLKDLQNVSISGELYTDEILVTINKMKEKV